MGAFKGIVRVFRRRPAGSIGGAAALGLAGDIAFGADVAQWVLRSMLGPEWFAWPGWPLVFAVLGVLLLWRAGAAAIKDEKARSQVITDLRGQIASAGVSAAAEQLATMRALLAVITKTDDMIAARGHLAEAEHKLAGAEVALDRLKGGNPTRMMRMTEDRHLGRQDFGDAVRLLNTASYILGEKDYDGRKLDGKIRWNKVNETDAPRPQREFDPSENEAYFASAEKALADAREFLRHVNGHAERLGKEAQQIKQGLTDARPERAV